MGHNVGYLLCGKRFDFVVWTELLRSADQAEDYIAVRARQCAPYGMAASRALVDDAACGRFTVNAAATEQDAFFTHGARSFSGCPEGTAFDSYIDRLNRLDGNRSDTIALQRILFCVSVFLALG
jgi:hypothetical protein